MGGANITVAVVLLNIATYMATRGNQMIQMVLLYTLTSIVVYEMVLSFIYFSATRFGLIKWFCRRCAMDCCSKDPDADAVPMQKYTEEDLHRIIRETVAEEQSKLIPS